VITRANADEKAGSKQLTRKAIVPLSTTDEARGDDTYEDDVVEEAAPIDNIEEAEVEADGGGAPLGSRNRRHRPERDEEGWRGDQLGLGRVSEQISQPTRRNMLDRANKESATNAASCLWLMVRHCALHAGRAASRAFIVVKRVI